MSKDRLVAFSDGVIAVLITIMVLDLFWLSLIPFVTGWMGENHFASVPTAAYGIVLVGAAIGYTIFRVQYSPSTERSLSSPPLWAAIGRGRPRS